MRQILPVGFALGNDGRPASRELGNDGGPPPASGPRVGGRPINLVAEPPNSGRSSEIESSEIESSEIELTSDVNPERFNDDGASSGEDEPVLE